MKSTIELLESIGKDASLRHASGAALEKMLEDMQASDELKLAARSGDAAALKIELGGKAMNVTNSIPNSGVPEDDDDDDDDDDQEQDEGKS